MSNKISSLTVAIPAYNEGSRITKVVDDCFSILPTLTDDGDVLVCNDGSRDDTPHACEKLKAQYDRFDWFSHDVNRGFGSTLKDLLVSAKGQWIAFIPSDGQIDPQELRKLVEASTDHDIVIGVRRLRHDAWTRRFIASAYNLWLSFVIGQRLMDVDGALLVRRSILDHVVLHSKSLFLQGELCAHARLRGFKIGEVSITHLPRVGGQASALRWKSLMQTIKDIFYFLYHGRWADTIRE